MKINMKTSVCKSKSNVHKNKCLLKKEMTECKRETFPCGTGDFYFTYERSRCTKMHKEMYIIFLIIPETTEKTMAELETCAIFSV